MREQRVVADVVLSFFISRGERKGEMVSACRTGLRAFIRRVKLDCSSKIASQEDVELR